jgi:conjugative relaxase-like TrwC/TraI family protein
VLRVTTIHANSAGASARYYTRYLADEGPDGEGYWRGGQADGLGLSGRVSTEDLEALLSGHDPTTGTRLGRALVDRYDTKGRLIPAVAGFDGTFSAPKSVSVWWGLTGDPGLIEAHAIAVRAVLEHIERYGGTTRVRRNGVRQHIDTGGLVMAAFGQATSREDDPQIHTHVVFSAKVQTPDGRWMALDARYLKRHQRALGGLYQSVLRAELTHRYGVAWGPIENGQAEIAGITRELLDAFSKRTTQVDAALEAKVREFRDRQGRDPSRWERAALTREAASDTRATKTGAPATQLATAWRQEAAALGWTPDRLVTAMRAAARAAPARQPLTLAEVVEQLTACGSTWTRADVLRAVCDLAPPASHMAGRDWAGAVEGACDRVVERCISLDPSGSSPVRASDGRSIWLAPIEPHLTHEHVLAQEERILLFAMEAHEAPARPSPTLERGGLDVLQADAAAAVAGEDRLVVGPAGAGKTTMLRHAAGDLHRNGRPVFAVAPTAKAAKVLRTEAGIPADSVAKLLHEWRHRQPADAYRLPAGTTLILDEAGMAGTGALDQLVTLAVSQRWRLVLVGDPRQLQAVGRGGMFDELCRGARIHELATIHRFRHRWEQAASLQLRAGNAEALDAYIDHGRVTEGTFEQLAVETAHAWIDHTAAGRRVAVVAETNEHVDQLNAAIQQARRQHGQLGPRVVRVAGGETAAVGDIVATRRNNRILRTNRAEPIRNRDRWAVVAVGRNGSLTVSHLDGHGQVTLPADYARAHVRLGYAATGQGHQGDTVDIGIGVATAATTHRSLYVAATRGRDDNRILVVTDQPGQARDVLEQILTNDRADTPAIAQRQHLATQAPGTRHGPNDLQSAQEAVAVARRALDHARRRAEPLLRPSRPLRPTSAPRRPICGPAAPPWRRPRSGAGEGWDSNSSTRPKSCMQHEAGETSPPGKQPRSSPRPRREPPTSNKPRTKPRTPDFATVSTGSRSRHPPGASSGASASTRRGSDLIRRHV